MSNQVRIQIIGDNAKAIAVVAACLKTYFRIEVIAESADAGRTLDVHVRRGLKPEAVAAMLADGRRFDPLARPIRPEVAALAAQTWQALVATNSEEEAERLLAHLVMMERRAGDEAERRLLELIPAAYGGELDARPNSATNSVLKRRKEAVFSPGYYSQEEWRQPEAEDTLRRAALQNFLERQRLYSPVEIEGVGCYGHIALMREAIKTMLDLLLPNEIMALFEIARILLQPRPKNLFERLKRESTQALQRLQARYVPRAAADNSLLK